jgi:hypothetical protein
MNGVLPIPVNIFLKQGYIALHISHIAAAVLVCGLSIRLFYFMLTLLA